jgi:hypothetical protein
MTSAALGTVVLSFITGFCAVAAARDTADARRFWGSAHAEPGAGLKVAKRLYSPAAELAKEYPVSQYRLFTIDLDQDGKDDFIAESRYEGRTCFIKSDLTVSRPDDTLSR